MTIKTTGTVTITGDSISIFGFDFEDNADFSAGAAEALQWAIKRIVEAKDEQLKYWLPYPLKEKGDS